MSGAESLKGRTALVTGASSGLGAAFARRLAAMGMNLVITARRQAELESLAAELRAAHGVTVDTIPLDLSAPDTAKVLFEKTEGAGKRIEVLINNAGFGTHQYFVDIPWERSLQQLQLNVVSLTQLTRLFAGAMLPRKHGYVLNVSSIGAYAPVPSYATYAAGKAYVRDFTEALAYELHGSGVHVCCLCPGGTLTGFQAAAGQSVPGWMRIAFMSADRCARIGLRALLRGRRNIVSGWSNSFAMFFYRLLPRRVAVWAGAVMMGPPEGEPPHQLAAPQG